MVSALPVSERPKAKPGFNYLTVQVTKRCNLRCDYCYLGEVCVTAKEVASAHLVKKVLRNLVEYHEAEAMHRPISVTYHGGEPLLGGYAFFESVLAYERELEERFGRHIFENQIQSNLTLLNERYCQIFSEYNVGLGTSIDGPAKLHNRWRFAFPGEDNHARVMEKVQLARSNGLHVGAICLITRDRLGCAREIYDFFCSERLNFKTNPVFIHGRAVNNAAELSTTEEEYSRFLAELFDIWYDDTPKIIIETMREFMGLVLLGAGAGSCSHSNCVAKHVTVAPNGECYPCGRTTEDEFFRLGNLNTEDFKSISDSNKLRVLLDRNCQSITPCMKCEVNHACFAGCMYEAFVKHGTIYAPGEHCASLKSIYWHVRSRIERDLQRQKERMGGK